MFYEHPRNRIIKIPNGLFVTSFLTRMCRQNGRSSNVQRQRPTNIRPQRCNDVSSSWAYAKSLVPYPRLVLNHLARIPCASRHMPFGTSPRTRYQLQGYINAKDKWRISKFFHISFIISVLEVCMLFYELHASSSDERLMERLCTDSSSFFLLLK